MDSSALARLPFLHGVPPSTIAAVKRVLRALSVTAGTILFRTGDDGDACYLVERGALRVMTAPDGEVLATVGPGAFVGELALLLGEPRSATVVADEDCALLALTRGDLDALLADHPALALAMTRELGRRIVHTNRRFAGNRVVRRSVVWPASYVGELAETVVQSGWRVGVGAIAGATLGRLRAHAERVKTPRFGADDPRLDAVLLGVGDAPSDRARSIVAEADHVVCFDAPPAWLVAAAPQRLVRVDSVERAARWATGRAVGVVFSSGGSKTVAHFGVMLALKEAGVEIDAVAGSSGGAFSAIGVAFGKNDAAEAQQFLDHLGRVTRWRRLDFNFPPRSGFAKGRRLKNALDKWGFGNLEDAPIPLWVVASDVANGSVVSLRTGPAADAIRASMSVPGIFDPWRVGSRLLIDGAVANPLPTDVLREAGVGIVIASNVAGQENEIDVLGRLPGLGQIVGRVLNTMERERIRSLLPLADVVIRPHVNTSNTFDFSNNDTIIEAGAEAARARLGDIRALLAAAGNVAPHAAHDR